MQRWHAEGAKSNDFPVLLTCEQQAQLRDLIVAMHVEMGEAEAGEYAAVVPSPQQFETVVQHLLDAIVERARKRWEQLTAGFQLKPWCESGCAEPASSIPSQIHKHLDEVADQLVYDAWSACEERLNVDAGMLARVNSMPQPAKADPLRIMPATPEQHRRRQVAQRLEKAMLDRGMSIGRLTTESGVDKKTLIAILHYRRAATPITLKRLADALGIPVALLAA